jgi:hypothetical protein
MVNEITIVIYKPSTQSTEEFVIIVNPVEVRFVICSLLNVI